MGKHTPGPWATEIAEYGSKRIGAVFAGFDIARICGKPAGMKYSPPGVGIEQHLLDAETDANARLIAAAPDLLAALQEASDHLAELYAKYQTKIGPFASQSQRINVVARAAISKATGEDA